MTLLLFVLLIAGTIAIGIVLADSGLRLWCALVGINSQQAKLRNGAVALQGSRASRRARVTTRISYARTALLRAAA